MLIVYTEIKCLTYKRKCLENGSNVNAKRHDVGWGYPYRASSGSESDQRGCLVCIRTHYQALNLRRCDPFPRHDVARSFQFCEPKFEVAIVGPTHLSRDKKFQKKIPTKT